MISTVKRVGLDVDKIEDDIKLLVVIAPKDISDKAQYAIDQFIMRGGRAAVARSWTRSAWRTNAGSRTR